MVSNSFWIRLLCQYYHLLLIVDYLRLIQLTTIQTTVILLMLANYFSCNLYVVMFCMPASVSMPSAYGAIGGYYSVYQDKSCSYLSSTMHEIGHNLYLAHSNENGNYGDITGTVRVWLFFFFFSFSSLTHMYSQLMYVDLD